jgi:RNA polymerase sigma factor FliA
MQNIIANSTMTFLLSLENLALHNEPLAPEGNESAEHTDALQEAIKQLDHDEQRLIQLFYTENLSQKEIAHQLNYSNSKVSRVHGKVLEKLRRRLSHKVL